MTETTHGWRAGRCSSNSQVWQKWSQAMLLENGGQARVPKSCSSRPAQRRGRAQMLGGSTSRPPRLLTPSTDGALLLTDLADPRDPLPGSFCMHGPSLSTAQHLDAA